MIQEIKKLKNAHSGFVILFAVTLAAILLSIALGVATIALREIKFGTSAKDTNEAFFAADTGAECALINDKSTANVFKDGGDTTINCNNANVTVTNPSASLWTFTISGLGAGNNPQGCAIVTVDKTSATEPTTNIISKGHNNNTQGDCSSGSNTVERQLEVSY